MAGAAGQLGPRFHRLLLRIWGDVEAFQASERWDLSAVSTAGPPTGRRRPVRTPHPGADSLSRLLSLWRSSGPGWLNCSPDHECGACPFAPLVYAIAFCSQKHQAILNSDAPSGGRWLQNIRTQYFNDISYYNCSNQIKRLHLVPTSNNSDEWSSSHAHVHLLSS